jgi:hypothetical protein
MTRIELDLIVLIYVMYLYECIHWLKEGDIAYTRSYFKSWKKWEHTTLSFTLLRRRPYAVNLFPFASGFISVRRTAFAQDRVLKILQRVDRFSRFYWSLRLASSVQAGIMLVLVPLVIGFEKLSNAWLSLLILVLASHIITATIFTLNILLLVKDRSKVLTDVLSVYLNPIAAIRSGDALVQRTFQAFTIQK